MNSVRLISICSALATALVVAPAHAIPVLRHQVDLRGDFVLLGNTLAQDCRGVVPGPIVGSVGPCGTNTNDDTPDVFWRSDSPIAGAAETTTTGAQGRSSAVLVLPLGATVSYARLYWAAQASATTADAAVTLGREGVFSSPVTSDASWSETSAGFFYQATADVTALVQQHGMGAYRVEDVDSMELTNMNTSVAFAAWSLVVVYADPSEPWRNITVFDGFDRVSNGNPAAATLSGFVVPNAGFDAKLGVIAYEGDAALVGDELRFGLAPLNASDRLSDALNPANDFFNSTRATLGIAGTVSGDLPELTGAPYSMSGVDLDVVDITSHLTAGQTAADVAAESSGDIYFVGAFVTAISTFLPEFDTSTKTAVDVNGGELVVGDELEYVLDVANSGNDASIGTTLSDVLPGGVSYVPGSLAITSGPNLGALTDIADGDQGEVVGDTVTVRLGAGADGANGGVLLPSETTTIAFRVTVDALGPIANQASISAAGQLGSGSATTPTDGDPGQSGAQATESTVHACGVDADCTAPTPACDVGIDPHLCVECLSDVHCPAPTPTCDVLTQTCGGTGAGGLGGTGMGGTGMGGAGMGGGMGGSGMGGTGMGGTGGDTPPADINGRYEGSGCRCTLAPASSSGRALFALLGVAALALRRRTRGS